jgi:acyl-CoA dehydrogenase
VAAERGIRTPVAFSLTVDQLKLIEEARRVARDQLVPLVEAGVPGRVNRPLLRALGESGLLPRLFPARAGGTADRDVSALELCLLREAVAQESTEAETALAMQGLGGWTILRAGSDGLVQRWVRAIARGEAVAAFALTEPNAGTDAAALELKGEPEGDGFRLTGEKTWISNAPDADVYAIFARTTEGARSKGVTAFVLPGGAPGLTGEAIELIGPHPIGRLRLDGVHVPASDVLGEVDGGFQVAMETLDLFRPSVGAFAVGMAQSALDVAVEHAGTRRAFGKPLRAFQAISQTLAEMATRTEAARLLVYAAADAYDNGVSTVTRTSAMAKLFATETAQWVVDAAIQIHGAAALERGHLLEHLYREVRAPRIYEGTSEIQREIIARELYRWPRPVRPRRTSARPSPGGRTSR